MSVSISATHTPNSGSSSNTSCGAELEWGNISISFLTLVIYYLLSHTCVHIRIAYVFVCIGIHYICFELILFSLCVICYYCSLITIITSRVCSVRFLLFSKQTTITQSHTLAHTHAQCLGWTFWQVKKTLGALGAPPSRRPREKSTLFLAHYVCATATSLENRFLWLFFREAEEFLCCAIFVFRLALLSISNCTS